MELEGRVAVVTGGGNGVGAAHALALAARGARIVVNDLGVKWSGEVADESRAERLAGEIRRRGGAAIHHHGDCSRWEDAEELVELALKTFGDLNVLILNAGINRPAQVADLDERDWDDVIRVHLKGSVAPVHFAARYWRAEVSSGRPVYGRVITTSSQVALMAGTESVGLAYMAAKAGILGFTQGLAGELAPLGVTVNCVIPGSAHQAAPPGGEGAAKRIVADRVSPIVAFLASPRADQITGNVFQSVGGRIDRIEPARVRPGIFADKVWETEDIAALYDEYLAGPTAPTRAEYFADMMAVFEAGGPAVP